MSGAVTAPLFDCIYVFRDQIRYTEEPDRLMDLFKKRGWKAKSFSDSTHFHIERWTEKAKEKRLCIVFPGGECSRWDAIFGERLKYLTSFVEKGGCYAGFCGGAYLAARESEYGNWGVKKRGIDLFLGSCKGPKTGRRYVKLVSDQEKIFYSYFKDGGALYPATGNANFKPILCFKKDGEIAAGVQSLGKGRALLCTAHPILNRFNPEGLQKAFPEYDWFKAAKKLSHTDGEALIFSLFKKSFSLTKSD